MMALSGNGLNPATTEEVTSRWADRLTSSVLPLNWKKLVILFLFDDDMPEELNKVIPQARKCSARSDKMIFTGWVRPGKSKTNIYPDNGAIAMVPEIKKAIDKWKAGDFPETDLQLDKLVVEFFNKRRYFEEGLARTTPWGTWSLIAFCLAMFVLASVWGGIGDGFQVVLNRTQNSLRLIRFGANYVPLLKHGQWWRLVGSMFMHVGTLHLLVNMYVLYLVGSRLEKFYGNVKFLTLYGIAGILGALVSSFFNRGVCAGASGAIFGLCGAAALIGIRFRKEIPNIIRNRLTGGMVFFILFNLAFGFTSSQIDNEAHIGGLVAGLIFAFLIPPEITASNHWSRSTIARTAFTILAFIPFAIQLYVVQRAVTWPGPSVFPTSSYKLLDRNIKITYPLIFQASEKSGILRLSGPGMSINVEATLIPIDIDLNTAPMQLEEAMLETRQLSSVDRSAVEEINGRKWIVISGISRQQNLPISLGFCQIGVYTLRVAMITGKQEADTARKIFYGILESAENTGPDSKEDDSKSKLLRKFQTLFHRDINNINSKQFTGQLIPIHHPSGN